MQKRSADSPARNPPRHKPSYSPGRNQKEKGRPHNRRDSPDRVRTQCDGALPDSSTFRTLYRGPDRQVASPAGSVTSECGPARFTRKACIVKQVTSPSRAESEREECRSAGAWTKSCCAIAEGLIKSEPKEFTAGCEDELCRAPSPAAQTETNPTSRSNRRQEIRIEVPPISRLYPQTWQQQLANRWANHEEQIRPAAEFRGPWHWMGESRNQGPVYAESSSYTRVKPPPRQNDSCSIFRTTCGKRTAHDITPRLAGTGCPPLLRPLTPQQSHSPPEASLLIGTLGVPPPP
jgi:hypothetical protein